MGPYFLLSLFMVPCISTVRSHTLEEIVQFDDHALFIWKFSQDHGLFDLNSEEVKERKLFVPNNVSEACLVELNQDKQLISSFIMSHTLPTMEFFVHEQFHEMYRNKRGNEISQAKEIRDNISNIVREQEKYLTAVNEILSEMKYDELENSGCFQEYLNCTCVDRHFLRDYKKELWVMKECDKDLQRYLLFGEYLDPLFRMVFILAGLIFNTTLIRMFFSIKSLRTEYNCVIINMVLNNILVLLIYVPISYISKYQRSEKYIPYSVLFLEVLTISANAIIIFMLNVQHYFDIYRALKPNVSPKSCTLSPIGRSVLYTCIIWSWSVLVAFLLCHVNRNVMLSIELLFYYIVYIFILSIALAVLSSVTSRKLQRATIRERTTSELNYVIGGGTILTISVAYYVLHIPLFIIMFFDKTEISGDSEYYVSLLYRVLDLTVRSLFYSYSTVNTVLLYKTHATFKFYYNKYCFRCWYNRDERQYLTMSSLENLGK
ncbi:hypothetical protein C0J52_22921 [Blattella germanica]|nr:hypothetical protein C0J52_22921 [Blattella germanica]